MRYRNVGLIVAVVVLMVASGAASALIMSPAPSLPSHAPAATSTATASTTASSAAREASANQIASISGTRADGVTSSSSAAASAAVDPSGVGPHPGTLEVYEPVPGGATTEDPAVAYDTTSYEVILNVYQSLIAYNGSSTSTFVPMLSTCVPGQGPQCGQDYGGGFTGIYNQTGAIFTGSNGEPLYYTFVLDPAARFYDPSTGASWGVYPSDVMFSIARTLGFSDLPYATKTAGWIMAQALLPPGNSSWDEGIHAPYNNTPQQILGSMLINDSAYCPTKAMDGVHGNGCVTFVADGSQQYWPEFLEFVADNLGASVVPCGWFTYESAGVPGWTGTHAAKGDGSCKLPNGGTSTSGSAWSSYLAGVSPTSWDKFEQLMSKYPAPQPNVRWSMVGSGPYYASITPGLSYALAANPAYAQPSGCSGAAGLAVYTGYCNPAPGGYIANVDVTWETAQEGDSLGTSAILAGTADFAGIYTSSTSTLLGFVHSGIWQYDVFPTLSDAFTPINLGVSYAAYNASFPGSPLESNPINAKLFTDIGLRNFYIAAYPYTTIENTINTVDGIEYSFNAGGPIPVGMGNYYPSNVSWPYLMGDPTQPATTVGSAAWWWAELTTPSSPYYNKTLVDDCTSSSPCTWPIGYFDGAPVTETLINDWSAEIYAISGHTLEPWPLAESFTQFLTTLVGPYESPLASVVGFGWAPDYPDPTDYMAPIGAPNGDYTGPDTFNNQLFLPQYENNATCGHYALTFADLGYWAKQAQNPALGTITSSCQGVAYKVASYFMTVAGALPAGSQRVLDYNLVEQITNALGMYVYNGQSNELVGFAPWIDPTSINENPMIGGGGDSVWYQVRYSKEVYSVTVNETGLPASTSWSATLGGSTLTSTAASITFGSQPNGTYNFSVSFEPGYTVSPSNGTVTVSGQAAYINVTYTTFLPATTVDLTFNQTGLVTNTTWSVVVQGYGSIVSKSPSLVFALPESTTYTYRGGFVIGYAQPGANSIAVGTSPLTAIVPYTGAINPTFAVKLVEVGLPAGSTWTASLGPPGKGYTLTSTATSVTFFQLNGSYALKLTVPHGYVASASSAYVIVSGTNVTVTIPVALAKDSFAVTVHQTGLTTGGTWRLTVLNLTVQSTGTTAGLSLPNGTYTYAISPIPGWQVTNRTGTVVVNNGTVSVSATFSLYTYELTFFEGGLKTGTSWSLEVFNATTTSTKYSSTTYFLELNVSNGTFNYSVVPVTGHVATPSESYVVVNSTAATAVIIFGPIPATYTVMFTATGLAAGATWTVYFAGESESGSGPSSVSFAVTNGTWTYSTSAKGYNTTASGGSVPVAGKAVDVPIAFTPVTHATTSSKPAWSYLGELAYGLIGAFVLLTLIGFGLAAHYARRKPPAPPESWTEGSKGGDGGSSSSSASTPEEKSS